MGLGVFVSRATIEQLGGSIAFDSTEGYGTTVRIWLPRNLAAALETPPDAPL
jgi:signal transduction histidine kinase